MSENSASGVPVAANSFEIVSVEIQRGRPSAPVRLDLLSAVGSRPALIDNRDVDRPLRDASLSTAVQTCSLLNMVISPPFCGTAEGCLYAHSARCTPATKCIRFKPSKIKNNTAQAVVATSEYTQWLEAPPENGHKWLAWNPPTRRSCSRGSARRVLELEALE